MFKLRNYTKHFINHIKIKLLCTFYNLNAIFYQEDITQQEGAVADTKMEGSSEENAGQNKRNNPDEDSTIFKKPARKKMVSSSDSDTKEVLNCMETLTEVVSKHGEFSVYV
jgi:replication-associated recombination protein RarA